MAHDTRDPWVDVKTINGFQADHVISALQKEVRRGNSENAALIAIEMVTTSQALEDFMWRRLLIIAVEDVGFGEVNAIVVMNALYQAVQSFDRGVGERKLFAVHAVRYLCGCTKDRSSDEMIGWILHSGTKPTIPDYALDMHTADGKAKGRGRRHFFEEASKLIPEMKDRDTTYRKRLMEMLDKGELED